MFSVPYYFVPCMSIENSCYYESLLSIKVYIFLYLKYNIFFSNTTLNQNNSNFTRSKINIIVIKYIHLMNYIMYYKALKL